MHVSAAEAGSDIVFARNPAWPGQPQLRHPGGQAGGHAIAVLHHARHTLAALEERAGEDDVQVDLFAAPPEPEGPAPARWKPPWPPSTLMR